LLIPLFLLRLIPVLQQCLFALGHDVTRLFGVDGVLLLVLVLVEGVFTDLDQVIVLFLYYLLKDFVWEFDFNFLFKVVF